MQLVNERLGQLIGNLGLRGSIYLLRSVAEVFGKSSYQCIYII